MSEIEYARSDGLHIVYRVLQGEGGSDRDVVMVSGGMNPIESLLEEPVVRRLLDGLSSLGRLVLFDRRGIGLSDAITDWDRLLAEQWAEDLEAVVNAAALDRPVVFSWHTTAIARIFAAKYPEHLSQLVLFNPGSSVTEEDRVWVSDALESMKSNVDGASDWMARILPNRWSDPAFREWSDRAGRLGASPAAAARLLDADFDARAFEAADRLAAQIEAPTLVLVRTPGFIPAAYFARCAATIPDAVVADLSPGDLWPLSDVDPVLAEITAFVAGSPHLPPPQRHVAALLFTDLVASTERAAELGDRRWKALLDLHDRVVRDCVGRHGGTVVKNTGDGALATLPSATEALRTAGDIRSRLGSEGLEIRCGVHVGEVDRRGDDISGLAVHIAARIMSEARPGQVLASFFAAGIAERELELVSVGARSLKGVDGEWELFELVS